MNSNAFRKFQKVSAHVIDPVRFCHIINPDYPIIWLACGTENNVSLITGEDGNGNLTAEDMIYFMCIALLVALRNSDHIQKAIEIRNECLILLNNNDKNSKDQLNSLRQPIYEVI